MWSSIQFALSWPVTLPPPFCNPKGTTYALNPNSSLKYLVTGWPIVLAVNIVVFIPGLLSEFFNLLTTLLFIIALSICLSNSEKS